MASNIGVMERTKAYHTIKAALCTELAKNRPASGRLPPIRTLAKDLGVGQSSLHQAIKELVSQGLLVSRPKLGTFITASPEDFRKEQTRVIPAATAEEAGHPLSHKWVEILYYKSNIAERFFMEAANAITDALAQFGPQITKEAIPHAQPHILREHDKPDVLVVINPSYTLDLGCGPSQAVVAVSTTQHVRFVQQDRFDLIALDDIQAGIMAGEHLRRLNWNDVCFLGVFDESNPSIFDRTSKDRLEGLTIGLGRPVRPEWQLRCWNYDVICGAEIVREWLKLSPRPPAVFAVSDDLAFGFISSAVGHGLRPGRDYQIIGLDGQQLGKDFGVGKISTVGAPMAEMGITAAKMLVERLANPRLRPRRLLLGADLIEGDTVVARSATLGHHQ